MVNECYPVSSGPYLPNSLLHWPKSKHLPSWEMGISVVNVPAQPPFLCTVSHLSSPLPTECKRNLGLPSYTQEYLLSNV